MPRVFLILGISALGPEKAEKLIAACGGWKSHANWALETLDGEKGEIRQNKAGTCWVIDLASPRREVMFAWSSGLAKHGLPVLGSTPPTVVRIGADSRPPVSLPVVRRRILLRQGFSKGLWCAGTSMV